MPATSSRAALGFALGLIAAGCDGGQEPRGEEATQPNVVLVVVDTLRADRLSCYGYERETSPQLDRFAAEGVRYARAISQAPWTTPSIGSLMTSRFPTELGILTEKSLLSKDEVLLAEVLQAGGYQTAAVVSHSFCSSEWNFDQGFDRFDESNVLGHEAVTSEAVTRRALEFADSFEAERPFFLWAHYFDPHFAYVDHPEFPFPGPEGYDGPVKSGMKYSLLRGMNETVDADDLEQVRRFYDSEIALTDRWIGALFDGLRERGLWDNTLAIMTADHGEEFNDHGYMGHSRSVYQELVNVPLLVKYPRGVAGAKALVGRVEERAVALLDVFPTVLELTGVPAAQLDPDRLAGVSLLGDGVRRRPLVSETSRRGGVRGLVDGHHKLVLRLATDQVELYDLDADPKELRDLAAERPELVSRLRPQLERWEADVRAVLALGSDERELDPEEIERLKALGYLGSDD